MCEVYPQVIWMADVASVEDPVGQNDSIWLQWRVPTNQNRE